MIDRFPKNEYINPKPMKLMLMSSKLTYGAIIHFLNIIIKQGNYVW